MSKTINDNECTFTITFSREEIEQIYSVSLTDEEWQKVADAVAERGVNLFTSYFETRDGIAADALDNLTP
jgi:hypothetical protein